MRIGGKMLVFNSNGDKRDLYFDTDCLSLLEDRWKLSKKQVLISAHTFYFLEEKRKLTPLYKAEKRGSSGSKWKRAYQQIKHERNKALNVGTLENLINAMGALYILNLYYIDETFLVNGYGAGFDKQINSRIFSVLVFNALAFPVEYFYDSVEFDRAIYIIKYRGKSFKKLYNGYIKDNEITMTNSKNQPEFKKYMQENPNYKIENILMACRDIFEKNFDTEVPKIICFNNTVKSSNETEAILNTGGNIYDLASLET
jgi:hypothetical protein